MANPLAFPNTYTAQLYPTTGNFTFPEFDSDECDNSKRYLPSLHPLGVAFSGGGPRAFSAALGQARGLYHSGLLDSTGCVSCVSGGTWFGTLFNYVSSAIGDDELLGPVVAPQDITLNNINSINSNCIGSALLSLTNSKILAFFGIFLLAYEAGLLPFDKIYSQILNALMLTSFDLESVYTMFSLDQASVDAIVKNNPELTKSNFYTARPGRPYFVAGATQIYPSGENQILRRFEYTPLYSGTPQLFKGQGQNGEDIGGGYVQSFAFDTGTPAAVPGSSNLVSVPVPEWFFLLSDVMGSSGAAPGAIMDCIGAKQLFPEFSYWPIVNIGKEQAVDYSIVDGGILENTGIVALLWRQYPVIAAFINTSLPIGSTSDESYQGIDGQISRLFGLNPPCDPAHSVPCTIAFCNQQNTQVFPKAQFDALRTALIQKKKNGEPTVFADSYQIVTPNSFGVPAYPNNGKVTVVWFYNDINGQWKSQLTTTIQELLKSTNPVDFMANFPNYATVFQNKSTDGIPEILLLTPQQINLLAHMSCYTVMNEANALKKLI